MTDEYKQKAAASYLRLLEIMERLRGEGGCPWDREQTHESLKRYLIEETYEVLAALEDQDDSAFCDELGDLLLQVVFHSQIASEENRFSISDVTEGINQKMIRRHPHVFGEETAETSIDVLAAWELIKKAEGNSAGRKKQIMQINDNLPALLYAQKVQDKAARVGFDWSDLKGPLAALNEEITELLAAKNKQEQAEELGDCFFSLVNVARFCQLDSEDCLKQAAKKFIRRFNYIEQKMEQQQKLWSEADMNELNTYWNEAKQAEKGE